jgi:hypothetical protein
MGGLGKAAIEAVERRLEDSKEESRKRMNEDERKCREEIDRAYQAARARIDAAEKKLKEKRARGGS